MYVVPQPQDDLSRAPGGYPAHLGAAGSAVATHLVEVVGLLWDGEVVHPAVLDLVDLFTDAVPDPLSEQVIHLPGRHLRLLVLLHVFQPFPTDHGADSHDGPGQGAAALSHRGNSPGQSATRLKDSVVAYAHLCLQSCKHGLRSTEVLYVVLKGFLLHLVEQLFSSVHGSTSS